MKIKVLSFEGLAPVTEYRLFRCVEILNQTDEDGNSVKIRKPLGILTVEGLQTRKTSLQDKIQDINRQIQDIEDWWLINQPVIIP